MKTNKKLQSSVLTIIILTLLFSCGQAKTNKDVSHIDSKSIEQQSISIDSFSDFPQEIDGCSCYFSNDSTDFYNKQYIYVNDFAQTSFLKINGVMTKFTQTEYKEIDEENVKAKYTSDNFEMTIEVKDGIHNGDETMLKTGTITLTDKNGKTVTKTFYGECGC
jgi:hypothetical protein